MKLETLFVNMSRYQPKFFENFCFIGFWLVGVGFSIWTKNVSYGACVLKGLRQNGYHEAVYGPIFLKIY